MMGKFKMLVRSLRRLRKRPGIECNMIDVFYRRVFVYIQAFAQDSPEGNFSTPATEF
jgi:hypothetical protein